MKSRRVNRFVFFLTILYSIQVQSQDNIDSLVLKYPFIKKEINTIGNDSISLNSFFRMLNSFEQQCSERVNVVHIGDSHIQADHFSGKIRVNMQRQYGNAGRGLIFPYRVARTNEPGSYKTSSNIKWDYRRNVFTGIPIPIGLGGVTIETADTSAEIKFTIKDQGELNYSFNRLTLFHAKSVENYDFAVYDTVHKELAYINSANENGNPYATTIDLDEPLRNFSLKPCAKDSSRNCARLYGLLLENCAPGILYNMIGVNGAEFRHFTQSEYFVEQMSLLKPDLIIISLGTNEAYSKRLNETVFYAQIDTLVKAIRVKNPEASILLTTPADSYRKVRRNRLKNPEMKKARNTIIDYCAKNNLAYWDLYEIMGGYGSMAQWYAKGMAAKDRLHFSGRGYQIQGALFYKALDEAYKKYKGGETGDK